MGTTMAFYNIMNQGLESDVLVEKMKMFLPPAQLNMDKLLEAFISPDILSQMHKQVDANSAHFSEIFGTKAPSRAKSGVIAYSASAKWLPFFEANCCEGYIASSKDAEKLSKIFGAPVLAFSIFDSDILFISYSDDAKNIAFDFAKPNFDEFEDFDTERYSTAFPEFMLDFCNQAELKEIWDEPDMVFADDRMEKICDLIQAPILYDSDNMPEGFQAIFPQ